MNVLSKGCKPDNFESHNSKQGSTNCALDEKKRFSSTQDYIQVDQSRHVEVVPQCYLR